MADIHRMRIAIWERYLQKLGWLEQEELAVMPSVPAFATNNAHMFFLLLPTQKLRDQLIGELSKQQIMGIFHYLPLHLSPFYLKCHKRKTLPNAEKYSERLLRLPLYPTLTEGEQDRVVGQIEFFFKKVYKGQII
jgi:dTDP-4-amino-4,6-dideoxygalactose transaminase